MIKNGQNLEMVALRGEIFLSWSNGKGKLKNCVSVNQLKISKTNKNLTTINLL